MSYYEGNLYFLFRVFWLIFINRKQEGEKKPAIKIFLLLILKNFARIQKVITHNKCAKSPLTYSLFLN